MGKLQIEIQMRRMIRPSTPTPNNLGRLNLSLFDQGAPRMYIPLLFHYLPTSECNSEAIITERCNKLQKSLALTLTDFYPLAGRFSEEEFSIQCSDQGVEYVETRVNADLAEFLHQGPKIELLNDLLPEMDHSSSPLLGVQVNLFNCGGLVIGIQISHMVADAFTFATFLNEWAQTCLTGTTTTRRHLLPSFGHMSSLFPTRALSEPQYSEQSEGGPKFITRRFVFDASAIAKLKDRINSSDTSMRPSRVVAVLSLIWKVLVGISLAKHGHSRDSSLLIPMNLRGKSNLASLEHVRGNYYVSVAATLEANKLMRGELMEFVKCIASTTRDTSLSIGKASADEIMSLSIKYGTEIIKKQCQGDEMDVYRCSSWCRFPWYEADFGWGKPSWVSSIESKFFQTTILMDTRDGDGIEAWVSLKENEMIEFERDPDILSSTSKIPFDPSIWIK